MEPIDTLITARWIIPIEPDGRVLEDHAVAIHHGRIVAIAADGARRGVRFAAEKRIERPTHVLLPGFVNAHTHAAMTLLRGAAESSSFEHWLKRQVWPLEQRWIDAEYVRDGTELAIADMLTSGTTCFARHAPVPGSRRADGRRRRRSAPASACPCRTRRRSWAGSANEYLDEGPRACTTSIATIR